MPDTLLQNIETKLTAIGESWQLVKELPGQMKATKEALDKQEAEVAALRRELDKIHKGRLGMNAQRIALHSIELGHAARVLVVRILGEAQRTAVWKEAT